MRNNLTKEIDLEEEMSPFYFFFFYLGIKVIYIIIRKNN